MTSELEALRNTISFLLARDFKGFRDPNEMGVQIDTTPENKAFFDLLPGQHKKKEHDVKDGSVVRVLVISAAADKIRQSHMIDIARGLRKAKKAFKQTPSGITDDLGIAAAFAAKHKESE